MENICFFQKFKKEERYIIKIKSPNRQYFSLHPDFKNRIKKKQPEIQAAFKHILTTKKD
ncbi:MAG: hypothetical protein JXL97_12845 [Bacteroidales bacterium]|nr:hypothetical protein [Bacteroidales bacterium]